jgi:hypothetical protein
MDNPILLYFHILQYQTKLALFDLFDLYCEKEKQIKSGLYIKS